MYEVEDLTALVENAGLGTQGVDIYAYHAPAEVQECIIVYPSNDPPIINPELPFYMKGKFQTIIRTMNYQDGLEKAKLLSDALTINNEDTTQMTIKECRPLYQVRVYRRSGSGELELTVTFQITYVQK